MSVASPDEAAIHAEWARDPSRFRAPPLWEVSHILFACDPRDEGAARQARIRADAVLEALRQRPGDFATLAATHSDCGSKSSGGTLGQLGPGDTVPEFETVLRGLADGETAGAPVLTRHGYHIVRMDALAEGAVLPFDAVRPQIAAAVEKAAWARAARDFVGELIAAGDISGADLRMARS